MLLHLIILKHAGSEGNDVTSYPCNTIKVHETVLHTHQSLAALPFTHTSIHHSWWSLCHLFAVTIMLSTVTQL